jgi:type IV secretion system protein VirB11
MAAPGKNTAVLDSVIAPLRKYLDDERVTELVINRPSEVGIERRGGWTWENEPSLDFKNLMALATAADRFDDISDRRTGANHRAARRPR